MKKRNWTPCRKCGRNHTNWRSSSICEECGLIESIANREAEAAQRCVEPAVAEVKKPRARVQLTSESGNEPSHSHSGLVQNVYWKLSVEGVRIAHEHVRFRWETDPAKRILYTRFEHAPSNLRDLFDSLCAVFDSPEDDE